jgi:hypothetical protein
LETLLSAPTRLSLQSTLAQDADHDNNDTLLSALLSQSQSQSQSGRQ